MRFKIDWANLVVGSKFSVFALFYFVFEGNFLSTSPWGAYIWRGDLTEGFFLRYWFGGAYIWRGLYMEGFTFGILRYFLTAGNTASAKGASLWGFLGANCSPRKC